MTATRFCPACRAEYLATVEWCPDCGVALTDQGPPAAAATRGRPGTDDELVYELGEWTGEERTQLDLMLKGEGVLYRWEAGTDLVVASALEDTIETLLDAVEFPEALDAVEEDDEEAADDEVVYAVMSAMYVAADRLQHSPGDVALAGEFYEASDAVAMTRTPFGVDPDVWQQVQQLASGVCTFMESDAEDDVIARDAAALRHLLSRYV